MNDVLLMHVLQSLADLAHVVDHLGLRHLVILVGDLVEQLATRQTEKHIR